jgi:predicted TIM-barrel fold metal-dependent hydrolase
MIDSHLHLIEPDRFGYPWLTGVPELHGNFNLKSYRAESSKTGITASIFMEVDVAEQDQAAEAQYFCTLAEDPSSKILGVVAGCRPESSDFDEQLTRIRNDKLLGVRRILHVVPDSISQAETFRRNIASLAEFDLSFDLCVRADQLPLVFELIAAAPQTQFILDHCANPPATNSDGWQAWCDDIARCADFANVACKFSGLGSHLESGLNPILEQVSTHFGWDRLLFGGDWPVCLLADTSLSCWTDSVHALLSNQTEERQAAFFSGNATRIYGCFDPQITQ